MSWIDVNDLAVALRGGVSTADEYFAADCINAANAYAFRRRAEAGYNDLIDIAPSADAKFGTTLYCVALFRERGSVDSYSSFEEFSTGIVSPSTYGQVNRLLGVPKPAVDSLLTDVRSGYRGIGR